jgi:hypothetical protein
MLKAVHWKRTKGNDVGEITLAEIIDLKQI